jgi:hypothetical protein
MYRRDNADTFADGSSNSWADRSAIAIADCLGCDFSAHLSWSFSRAIADHPGDSDDADDALAQG